VSLADDPVFWTLSLSCSSCWCGVGGLTLVLPSGEIGLVSVKSLDVVGPLFWLSFGP
jgi:hypothetical protein